MADAAARREARRKRILENSENRLQLISGKTNVECIKESPVTSTNSIPATEYQIPEVPLPCNFDKPSLDNGVLLPEPEESSLLSNRNLYQELIAGGDVNILSDLPSLLPQSSEPTNDQNPTQTLWDRIVSYKYDIVLISLLIQLLYYFGVPIFEDHYIFLPLMVYTTTKVMWLPRESNSNIANALLLLNGMSSARIQKLMFITKIFGAFSQDVCIFLFTTVCIQAFCLTFSNSLLT